MIEKFSRVARLPMSLAALLLFATPALALTQPLNTTFVNKDLVNKGPASASDLTVVLYGLQFISDRFMGYSDRSFGSFGVSAAGPNTALKWDVLSEPGGNGLIDPGEVVHVGWGARNPHAIKDMYWTNANGQRIPGSVVCNATSHWTYETASRIATVSFVNEFDPTPVSGPLPLTISDVRFMVVDAEVPLAALNLRNTGLNGQLRPIDVQPLTIAPNNRTQFQIPATLAPNTRIVIRYNVDCPGSAATTVDFNETEPFGIVQVPVLQVNKDLRNVGSAPAFDVSVLLAGAQAVTNRYLGYSERRFTSFSFGPQGTNTLLKWDNLLEQPGNNRIDPGEIVHVGWSTAGNPNAILDMFWTDAVGQRIPGNVVCNVTPRWTFNPAAATATAVWTHTFDPGIAGLPRPPIQISDARFLVSPTELPLEQLNLRNDALNANLRPWDVPPFTLVPGQDVALQLPVAAIPAGSRIVLRYNTDCPGGAASAVDFTQSGPMILAAPVPGGTPTSLVVLAAGLLGSGALLARLRRRRTSSRGPLL